MVLIGSILGIGGGICICCVDFYDVMLLVMMILDFFLVFNQSVNILFYVDGFILEMFRDLMKYFMFMFMMYGVVVVEESFGVLMVGGFMYLGFIIFIFLFVSLQFIFFFEDVENVCEVIVNGREDIDVIFIDFYIECGMWWGGQGMCM